MIDGWPVLLQTKLSSFYPELLHCHSYITAGLITAAIVWWLSWEVLAQPSDTGATCNNNQMFLLYRNNSTLRQFWCVQLFPCCLVSSVGFFLLLPLTMVLLTWLWSRVKALQQDMWCCTIYSRPPVRISSLILFRKCIGIFFHQNSFYPNYYLEHHHHYHHHHLHRVALDGGGAGGGGVQPE